MTGGGMTTAQAVAEARKFTNFVRAFKKLEDVCQVLESADQLIKEREAAKAKLESELGILRDEVAACQAQAEEARESAKRHIADAEERVAVMNRKFEEKALSLEAQATRKLEQLEERCAEATTELREINQKLEAAHAEHAAVTEALGKLKADIAGAGG